MLYDTALILFVAVATLKLLRRPEVSYAALLELVGEAGANGPDGAPLDDRLMPQVQRDLEVRARYSGYIERAELEIERTQSHQDTPLPADLDEHTPGHGTACKRMANVGFDGIKGDDEDLRAAWRDKLEREGKLNPAGGSVKDLVFEPDHA